MIAVINWLRGNQCKIGIQQENIYLRPTMDGNPEVFFLLPERPEADKLNFWREILKEVRSFGVEASVDDSRFWKRLGGERWGWKPLNSW